MREILYLGGVKTSKPVQYNIILYQYMIISDISNIPVSVRKHMIIYTNILHEPNHRAMGDNLGSWEGGSTGTEPLAVMYVGTVR
jgi:hypothetical protein